MRLLLLLTTISLALSAFPAMAHAEIYKWVDKSGQVHFTDTPPPTAAHGEIVTPEPNRVEGYGKVPERRQPSLPEPADGRKTVSSKNLPIIELFVTSWCGYCKKAEAYFRQRDIPYVKYDIEKDRTAARRKASLTRSRGVPFVMIGEIGISGFSEAAFDKALRQYR